MKSCTTWLLWMLLALWMIPGGGCATKRIDWDARIGTYLYDDAIREMGPPEKSAQLTDGSIVADWLVARGMRTATAYGGGFYPVGPYGYGWGGPSYVIMDPPAPDRLIRLTFDTEGRLVSWRRVYQ